MAGNTFAAGGPKAAARSQSATGNAGNVSEEEDLANFISMISRDEVPFLSSIGRSKATAIFHEWQTDALGAPVAGQVAEGRRRGRPQPLPGLHVEPRSRRHPRRDGSARADEARRGARRAKGDDRHRAGAGEGWHDHDAGRRRRGRLCLVSHPVSPAATVRPNTSCSAPLGCLCGLQPRSLCRPHWARRGWGRT